MARLAARSGLVVLALAVQQGPAGADKCSKLDESCQETGCCSTPKSACYKKNDEVAFCRLGCEPGVHPEDPKKWRTPWSCEILTWGCSVAWKPCEGGAGQDPNIIPCCQMGCICNYTSEYFHQCVPPDGQNDCSKDGPLMPPSSLEKKEAAKPTSAEHAGNSGDSAGGSGGGDAGDCFEVGGVMMGPDCPEEKAEVLPDGGLLAAPPAGSHWLFASAAGLVLSAVVAAAALTAVARRRRAPSDVERHRLIEAPEADE